MRYLLLVIAVLAASAASAAEEIIYNGDGKVNVVFLAEGFTISQQEDFKAFVSRAIEGMLNESPYSQRREDFNFYSISLVSNESGADKPPEGIYVDTILGASYYWGNPPVERCLFAPRHKVLPYLNEMDVDVDVAIVLVNDEKFGGCTDREYLVTSVHDLYIRSILHEMGHALGFLGDEASLNDIEYTGPEPGEANLTINPDIATVKWKFLIEDGNGVGLFEGGKHYKYGIYRPTEKSMMSDIREPYGPVNEYYINQQIDQILKNKMGTYCGGEKATIIGTEGNDRLRGTFGKDVIVGLGGDDRIYGVFGDDILCGGEGDDYIHASFGDDVVFGGEGNDTIIPSFGRDVCDGGPGVDRIRGKDCEVQWNVP